MNIDILKLYSKFCTTWCYISAETKHFDQKKKQRQTEFRAV